MLRTRRTLWRECSRGAAVNPTRTCLAFLWRECSRRATVNPTWACLAWACLAFDGGMFLPPGLMGGRMGCSGMIWLERVVSVRVVWLMIK